MKPYYVIERGIAISYCYDCNNEQELSKYCEVCRKCICNKCGIGKYACNHEEIEEKEPSQLTDFYLDDFQ